MPDESRPTICTECAHFPGGEWANAKCPIEPFLNYVTGEPLYRHCHQKNTGNCRGYAPAERIAAQAQADGEGVQE